MKKIAILISLLSLLCLMACSEKYNLSQRDPEAGSPSSRAVEILDYELPIDFEADIDSKKIIKIVSQSDFDRIFKEFPGRDKVDFSKYHLLLVKGQSYSGITNIYNKFTEYLDKYLWNIDIYHNIASVAPIWYVAVMVPHLPASADINLEVKDIY